jgi:DegV family protein with EDD domain
MVGVVTDTCASIPRELTTQLGIEVVSYYIHRGSEVLRDTVESTGEDFYTRMVTAQQLPTTAAPGPGEYLEAFKRVAQRAKEIVSVHMTSLGSAAYQSGVVAKEMAREALPDVQIEVIDTLQVAMVHGWSAIEAARAALAGRSLVDVVAVAKEVAAKGMMIQTADTLKYLYMGGRIGRAQHLVGTLLNIKPLIGMEQGVIVALGQARSRTKAYQEMVELMAKRVGWGARIKIGYTHVAALEEIAKLRALVEPKFDCVEVIVTQLSPALGVHTGPGTVGVCFFAVG